MNNIIIFMHLLLLLTSNRSYKNFFNNINNINEYYFNKNKINIMNFCTSSLQKRNENNQNNEKNNKLKMISISPGGIKGFYLMGITSFIKENYSLDDYIFTGASAGAWNALFMTFNQKNTTELIKKILDGHINKAKSIKEIENHMKNTLLSSYKTSDFDLDKLFIGITAFHNYQFKTQIISNFESLEDAIDCCIASSHIPFITGGLTNKYHNQYTFDGGFSKYPYLNTMKPNLHITPSIWINNKNKKSICNSFFNHDLFLSKNKFSFYHLYENGYNDTKKNKNNLDSFLS